MILWVAFITFVILALALDLGVFNKTPHEVKPKEAAMWTTVWVSCALIFAAVIYYAYENGWVDNPTQLTSSNAVMKYITGYLIELSLSVDNIFIIAVIFSTYAIPKIYQHEVLFYGVLGAIIFRALMIFFGVVLINKFSWMIYVFGVFLILTALKMLFSHNNSNDAPNKNAFKWIRKIYPVTNIIANDKFFIKKGGIRFATPLFVALIIVEFTDILFAIDSIPAILAITTDPFIVFSSNIFAVMGLRSMFFFVVGMLEKFKYISYSLVVILAFVGVKMIISHHVEIPEWLSLAVIISSLTVGMLASKYINSDADVQAKM